MSCECPFAPLKRPETRSARAGALLPKPLGFSFVMAGLDPAIHVFSRYSSTRKEDVDAWHKAGHDGCIIPSDARCWQIGTFPLCEKCLETIRQPVRRFEVGITGS
jgi:hypothetical protein